MTQFFLPQVIEDALAEATPQAIFTSILSALGEVLQVDRCFLLLRNPHTRYHKICCWRRNINIPDASTQGWQKEQEWEREDPLFAAALRTEPSIFVEDIETAPPTVLNRVFEQKVLGHRALVHAHLCQDGLLWGILQPCVFEHPRVWSEFDRFVITQVTQKLTPIVINYIQESANRSGSSSNGMDI